MTRLLLLALLVFSPGALAYGISAGPVQVQYSFPNQADCFPSRLAEACLLSYDPGGPGLGDDTLYQYRAFDDFEARVIPPEPVAAAPVPREVAVTQEQFLVPIPVGQRLADLLDEAQAPLPAAVRERARLTFSQTGFILYLSSPDPANLSQGRIDWTTNAYPVPTFAVNRTHVRVSLGTAPNDSDTAMELARYTLTECSFRYAFWGRGLCPDLPVGGLFDDVNASAPRVVSGAWMRRTAAGVGPTPPLAPPENLPSPARLAPSAPTTGWSFPREEAASLRGSSVSDSSAGERWEEPRATPAPSPDISAGSAGASTVPVAYMGWLAAAVVAAFALPLLALFHRITGQRALRDGHRARIMALTEAQPGIRVAEVAEQLGLTFHSARHHAGVLARCGHVDLVRSGRSLALYPRGSVDHKLRAPLVALRRGPQAEVLRVVGAHPGLRLAELARVMGGSKSAAHTKLASLRAGGLVTRDGAHRYAITAAGLIALAFVERGAEPSAAQAVPALAAPT